MEGRPTQLIRGAATTRRVAAVLATCCAAGYSWAVAATTPFTDPADALVALASAGLVAVPVLQRLVPAGPWRRLAPAPRAPWSAAAAWLVVIGILVGTELAMYFLGGSRAAHPTVSSVTDAAFGVRAVKAAGFLAWLAVGWELVRR